MLLQPWWGGEGTAKCYCSLGEVGQGTATCYCSLGEVGQGTATCYCSLGEVGQGTATCFCSLGEVGQGTATCYCSLGEVGRATCYCSLGEVGQPQTTKATTIFVKCNKNVSQERAKEREKQRPAIPSVDTALLAASGAAKLDHVLT